MLTSRQENPMRMTNLQLAFIVCGFAVIHPAQGTMAETMSESRPNQFVLDYDPSYVALSNDHQSAYYPQTYFERWRIVTDLNGDGSDDLILSEDPAYFGNGGGPWDVYISSNGNWRCIGDVGLYPGVFAFDKVHDEVDLWYYSHCSAQEGVLGYYSFNSTGMRKVFQQMMIRTEGDEDNVFNRIDNAIFGCAHRHPYRFEKSETSTNGVVTWRTVGDWQKPCRIDELGELKLKLSETEKRAQVAEEEVLRLTRRLSDYENGVYGICGITLGEKWNGGETNRVCEEEFSGFTNLAVSVDANGFVTSISLSRNDGDVDAKSAAIKGSYVLTDEEIKIIHQVENKFKIRLKPSALRGSHFWGGPAVGTYIELHFSTSSVEDSYIKLKYLGGFRR